MYYSGWRHLVERVANDLDVHVVEVLEGKALAEVAACERKERPAVEGRGEPPPDRREVKGARLKSLSEARLAGLMPRVAVPLSNVSGPLPPPPNDARPSVGLRPAGLPLRNVPQTEACGGIATTLNAGMMTLNEGMIRQRHEELAAMQARLAHLKGEAAAAARQEQEAGGSQCNGSPWVGGSQGEARQGAVDEEDRWQDGSFGHSKHTAGRDFSPATLHRLQRQQVAGREFGPATVQRLHQVHGEKPLHTVTYR